MAKREGKGSGKKLQEEILRLMGEERYRPLDKNDLAKELGLSPDQMRSLRQALKQLETQGRIARIRKDRYLLPEPADLFTGVIQITPQGFAFITREEGSGPDLFVAAENTSTAMNGDRVVARIQKGGVANKSRRRGRPSAKDRQEGRVIRILERKNNTIVGTLQTSKKFFFVVPDDPRMVHNIYVPPEIRDSNKKAEPGQKVVVELESWESRHINPEGSIVEVLGRADDPGVDILSILRKYHLPGEFPEAVRKEVENLSDKVSEKEIRSRMDCRNLPVVTIDPDDAKDFDDAIHVRNNGKGWTLSVFIADVAHYVRTGSALDREALSRGNSVYLVDRVIPMLPERLSNDICSLRPKVDRLAMAALMEFDNKGNLRKAKFGPAIIRSRQRLTYQEAMNMLEKGGSDPVTRMLQDAWKLASALRQKRFDEGSLELDFPDIKVRLDKKGRPIRIDKMEYDESHQLIEEFMLAANEAVAREIRGRGLPSLYRIHEEPDADRLEDFQELAAAYGFKTGNLSQRGEVKRFLKKIRGTVEEYPLKLGFLKSLKRAAYSPKPLGHYGLAKSDYTHFTSPIRRYADLVVHRVTRQLLGQRLKNCSRSLEETATAICITERTASDAERESVRLKQLEYFKDQSARKKPETFPAVVVDVRNYGLVVELPDHLMTGLIHVSTLPDDFFVFDSGRLRFVGRRSRRVFQLGDKLKVRAGKVDLFKRQVDFLVV